MMPQDGMFCMQIANYIMLKMLYKEKIKTGFSFLFSHSPLQPFWSFDFS